MKFNTASGPTGYVEINYNGGGKAYRVRSDDIDSLGAFAGNADVRATASLTDITNRRRPILVADNLTLRLTADGNDPMRSGSRCGLGTAWCSRPGGRAGARFEQARGRAHRRPLESGRGRRPEPAPLP